MGFIVSVSFACVKVHAYYRSLSSLDILWGILFLLDKIIFVNILL